MSRKFILSELKDYAFIMLGVLLYAFGVTVFMLPYGLTSGGVSGISSIVFYVTGIEVQVSYIAINAVLLVVAIKELGLKFCLKTIFGVLMLSFFLWMFQRIIEQPEAGGGTMLPRLIGDESFMAAILGSICCGVGLAFCFENNGSTGGTDIIAAIVHKYKPISLGSVIRVCDILIVSSCYFIFHDWARVIYGFVILFTYSVTLDYCIRRQHKSVQFLIFSRNADAIADAIIKSGHGATMLSGEGWYTHTERKIVTCVINRHFERAILHLVKDVDPFAFISMSDASQVWGEGFDAIKTGMEKKGDKPILVFASNSGHKISAVRSLLKDRYDVRSLADIGCFIDIPERASSIKGNALLKARFVKRYYGYDCLADDTALECAALGGLPGVHSRNYGAMTKAERTATSAAPSFEEWDEEVSQQILDILHTHPHKVDKPDDRNDSANIARLLDDLDGKTDRRARLHSVVAYIGGDFKDPQNWRTVTFDGILEGRIADHPSSDHHDGYFYDTVFIPNGFDKPLHFLGDEAKSLLSQRAVAVNKLKAFLDAEASAK
ncbi:MAG: non-canonical purine NTP pyrophosphatase [Marinilabiliaceae bacterium]